MPDYFYSPKRKLARAKKHIGDLKRERDRFVDLYSNSSVVEINPDSGLKEFKVVIAGYDFGEFSDIAADAFQNLRSTLDHACAASAWAKGVTGPRPCAYFPVGATSHDLGNSIKGRCKDLHPDVIALLRTFNPYKTGNRFPFLWALADTANIDKHAVIRPYVPSLRHIFVEGGTSVGGPVKFIFSGTWNAQKYELVFATCPATFTPQYDIHPKIDITLAEGHGIDTIPALLALDQIANVVESVLMAIEAETRRLFPAAFA
jgi:hypothetical protein